MSHLVDITSHPLTYLIYANNYRYSGHKTGDFYVESCVDNTDSFIFSGSTDGAIWCWDLVKMTPVNQLIHKNNAVVHTLSSNPSKKDILSASGSTIKLWKSSEISEMEETANIPLPS